MAKIPLDDQIAEVEREIALRMPLYAERLAQGAMLQEQADTRMQRMFAVLHTLRWLQDNETRIKAMLKGTTR